MGRLTLLAAVSAVSIGAFACDPGLSHRCTSAPECVRGGEQGVCEATGRCSFPDPSCTSGKRYSEWAGELESQCVVGGSEADGGPDAGAADARPVDGPPPDARAADARADAAPPDARAVDASVDAP